MKVIEFRPKSSFRNDCKFRTLEGIGAAEIRVNRNSNAVSPINCPMLSGKVPVIWSCRSLRSSNDCRLLILLGIDPETFALSSTRCRKLIFSKNDRGHIFWTLDLHRLWRNEFVPPVQHTPAIEIKDRTFDRIAQHSIFNALMHNQSTYTVSCEVHETKSRCGRQQQYH